MSGAKKPAGPAVDQGTEAPRRSDVDEALHTCLSKLFQASWALGSIDVPTHLVYAAMTVLGVAQQKVQEAQVAQSRVPAEDGSGILEQAIALLQLIEFQAAEVALTCLMVGKDALDDIDWTAA